MPKRQQLLDELKGEDALGVLLAVQMGGVPNELQLLVQTAYHDEAAGGLRERTRYIIRALSVEEHKLSVGLFGQLRFSDDHPLLYPHNMPSVGVFFRGKPDPARVHELVLDISQAHASTFGPWRHIAEDINAAMPLFDLVQSGGGLLGEMPKPAAERMAKVFAHHGMESKLIEDPNFSASEDHGRSTLYKLLLIDEGHVTALDFSVDVMGSA